MNEWDEDVPQYNQLPIKGKESAVSQIEFETYYYYASKAGMKKVEIESLRN